MSGPDDAVSADLEAIEAAERKLLNLCMSQLQKEPRFGTQHIYLWGVARRTLALAKAFRQMIDSRNSIVALSLVRMQLDTMLRLYALFFVQNPQDFATKVFQGEQVNKMKDAKGRPMTDGYLARRVATQNPWVASVYSETSGYIHFSCRHMLAAFSPEDEGDVGLVIGADDYKRPLEYCREPVAAFLHITEMIPVAAEDWFSRLNGSLSSSLRSEALNEARKGKGRDLCGPATDAPDKTDDDIQTGRRNRRRK